MGSTGLKPEQPVESAENFCTFAKITNIHIATEFVNCKTLSQPSVKYNIRTCHRVGKVLDKTFSTLRFVIKKVGKKIIFFIL